MNEDLKKLHRIIAKTFRKAKQWYLGYLLCQISVLLFAIATIFTNVNPNASAVIALLSVLATELVRWRSDTWKSEGETAKRKWELEDGLGTGVDSKDLA